MAIFKSAIPKGIFGKARTTARGRAIATALKVATPKGSKVKAAIPKATGIVMGKEQQERQQGSKPRGGFLSCKW